MSIINFTVKYDQLASQTDSADQGADADIIALVGPVTFTPVTADDKPLLAPAYLPRPAGLKLLPFSGYLDTDGRLKNGPGGTVGVRLWANDPVLDLDSLAYRVTFNLATELGERVDVEGGLFLAPNNDQVVNLVDVLQSTTSLGGPRISSGYFDSGSVVFENEDGTVVDPIEIPNGTLVFIDNGDGTWSVG